MTLHDQIQHTKLGAHARAEARTREETALAAYRVVQESVTNIFRHAGADKGEVTLEFGFDASADSSGFDAEAPPQLGGGVEDGQGGAAGTVIPAAHGRLAAAGGGASRRLPA